MNTDSAIVIWAEFEAKPGGEDALRSFLASVVDRAAVEPGCERYELLVSTAPPSRFFLHEVWKDDSAIQQHRKMEYVRSFKEGIAPLLSMPYKVNSAQFVTK